MARTLWRTRSSIAAGLVALLSGITAQASVSEVIAVGTMAYSELFGGPATITVRRLLVAPGEVLGWHSHPGVGAYTIVKRGALTIEDGCGGETIYTAGQAFLEPPGRVHRGKNEGTVEAETVQTFIVPTGSPISVSTERLCGPPTAVSDCQASGWMAFSHPRSFSNQGDCAQFVNTGR